MCGRLCQTRAAASGLCIVVALPVRGCTLLPHVTLFGLAGIAWQLTNKRFMIELWCSCVCLYMKVSCAADAERAVLRLQARAPLQRRLARGLQCRYIHLTAQ